MRKQHFNAFPNENSRVLKYHSAENNCSARTLCQRVNRVAKCLQNRIIQFQLCKYLVKNKIILNVT